MVSVLIHTYKVSDGTADASDTCGLSLDNSSLTQGELVLPRECTSKMQCYAFTGGWATDLEWPPFWPASFCSLGFCLHFLQTFQNFSLLLRLDLECMWVVIVVSHYVKLLNYWMNGARNMNSFISWPLAELCNCWLNKMACGCHAY